MSHMIRQSDHELLWACYTSGQMSEAQLEGHMQDDPDFAEWVRAQSPATRTSDA